MRRTNTGLEKSPLLPSDATPCIWMTAGLVAYRLCDRDHECDDCPLDRALRGDERPPRPEPDVDLEAAPELRYGGSHTWIRGVADRQVRCGLDPFAAGLLAGISGVVMPVVDQPVRHGRIACWFRDEDRVLPLKMPVSGIVRRVNRSVQSDPALLSRDPFGQGWLFELDCAADLDDLPNLVSPEDQMQRVNSGRKRLREQAAGILKQDKRVGPTLADGGARIADLRKILGPRRYFRLIRSILE